MTDRTTLRWLAAGAVLVSSVLASQAAWADSKSVDRSGPNGGGVHKERVRGEGDAQRGVERTGPAGRAMSRSSSRTYDPATGTYNAEQLRSYTGLDGQTASQSRTVTRDADSATVTRRGTGPQGQTWEYQRGHSDGHKEAALTGPNGQTATRSRDIVNNADGTVTVQQQATGPDGASRSRSRTYGVPESP